ncbi:metallophosphoesterase [Actinopolymorpha sp. B11F2]|uniref:metallophosphoesterase family protein n=1 Tax=Actinopolymorpha sp. B11F2 TaxID=3160862 RepID=UPI0032E39584
MSGAESAGPTPLVPEAPGAIQPQVGKNGEAWAWTQLTAHGTVIRFATTEAPAGSCPTVNYTDAQGNRAPHPMIFVSGRGGTTPAQFPTTVCRLPVPEGARDAVLQHTTTNAATIHPANLQLPLPRWSASGRPRSVAVIGDTGCDTESTNLSDNQNCSKDWHFQGISTNAAALSRPDLVVHVGDYVYRFHPELANDRSTGCNLRGQDDDFGCLVKDFLRPAEALLGQAPVLFARGNHELCSAGVGRGAEWFRYLATDLQSNDECFTSFTSSLADAHTEPVQIDAGSLHFILFDSSLATDIGVNQTQAREYARFFDHVNALARNNPKDDYFLISHKPLWLVKAASSTLVESTNRTLQSAVGQTSGKALADNVRLVLSGHEHLYQMLDFTNSTRPAQVTVGSSGTKLDTPPVDALVQGKTVDGQQVNQSISHDSHGYALLRDVGGRWHLTYHDSAGTQQGKDCVLSTGTTTQFACT